MKVIVDALGAPAQSGGMRLYAQELIHAWADEFSDDHLLIVGGGWVGKEFARSRSVETISVPNECTINRVLAQFVLTAYLFKRRRPDFLLSLSPIASPLVPKTRRMCVVHDWRHLKNSKEFGLLQRAYRILWKNSVNGAGMAIAISHKTAEETRRVAPRANVRLVENGRDHASRWPAVDRQSDQALILTFGHHPNKRPDLVIRALAKLKGRLPERARLVILGVRGEYKGDLQELAVSEGVERLCEFPGFVSALEYQTLVQQSSVIVLASSDEGFGLPVTEGQFFGIPVICTADSGLASIHGGDLLVADPIPDAIAGRIGEALKIGVTQSNVSPTGNTWADVARNIRSLLLKRSNGISNQ